MSDTDDLAGVLYGLEIVTLTTAAVTARITRAIVEWAAAHAWQTRTEARVGVGEETRLGFVDVIVLRQPSAPDLAIEIDSADKPWSVDKLRHVAAAGMHAVWIRWGSDEWAGVHEGVDVIQLPVMRRAAPPAIDNGQLSLWP